MYKQKNKYKKQRNINFLDYDETFNENLEIVKGRMHPTILL